MSDLKNFEQQLLDFANLREQYRHFRSQVTNDPDFMRLHLYAAPASHYFVDKQQSVGSKPAYLEFIDGRI